MQMESFLCNLDNVRMIPLRTHLSKFGSWRKFLCLKMGHNEVSINELEWHDIHACTQGP